MASNLVESFGQGLVRAQCCHRTGKAANITDSRLASRHAKKWTVSRAPAIRSRELSTQDPFTFYYA